MHPRRKLLKSAYRNGHVSMASDAKQHIDALIASFDDDEEEDGKDDTWVINM